jgi:hypothetical protein
MVKSLKKIHTDSVLNLTVTCNTSKVNMCEHGALLSVCKRKARIHLLFLIR